MPSIEGITAPPPIDASLATPQDLHLDTLTCRLHSNQDVVLGHVNLYEWFPNHDKGSSLWAVLGVNLAEVPSNRWNRLQLQVTGLEYILGNAISRISWPVKRRAKSQFVAELNRDRRFKSKAANVSVVADYWQRFSGADPFEFVLHNFANLTLTGSRHMAVDEWLQHWIQPLRVLTTIATGREQRITFAEFSVPSRDHPGEQRTRIRGTLFGGGIHQEAEAATSRLQPDGRPLRPLFLLDEAPPLAGLITRISTAEDQALRTALSLYQLSMRPEIPLSLRFLLLIQALEGLHTSDNASTEEEQDARYADKRVRARSALSAVPQEFLDADTRKFIQSNIPRRPNRDLAERLRELFSRVPGSIDYIRKWNGKTSQLANQLRILSEGRRIPLRHEQLHERLASARNVLSHGEQMPEGTLTPATQILDTLLRGLFLERLEFSPEQVAVAYERMEL